MKLLLAPFCAMLLPASAGLAQEPPDRTPAIVVLGVGEVHTPPDVATISFSIRGEGRDAVDATRTLVARQQAILAGLAELTHGRMEVRTGNVQSDAARAGDCQLDRFGNSPSLSTGDCAITGYIATLDTTVRLTEVKLAGTATALAAQRGATSASITGFDLVADKEARQRATAAALLDARTQAEAIAAGAHQHLGRLLSVRDQRATENPADEVVVTGARLPAPPQDVAPPPPTVDLSPAPIATTTRLTVTYAIEP